MKCATCKFYVVKEQLCRRMPPMPFPVPAIDRSGLMVKNHVKILSAFAPVESDQWCGEYVASLEAVANG